MRSLLQIWVVSATLLCGNQAFAQATGPLPPEPDRVTLTPFLGAGFGGDLESAPFTFGAALGYGLTSRWSVEGDLYFQPDGAEGQLIEFDTTLWALVQMCCTTSPARTSRRMWQPD